MKLSYLKNNRTARIALLAITLVWAFQYQSSAAIMFVGSDGDRAASVCFDVVAGNLQVTLSNTSLKDVTAPSEGAGVLTAVFFDLMPTVVLTPVSAMLASGSVVHFGPEGGGNVGGEWAYAGGLSGAPGNAALGISSAGFDLFGAANFGGNDLDKPVAVNGLNYGITSLGDDIHEGNRQVTGNVPLIQHSVVFTLSGDPAFTTIENYTISNVTFQYGTNLSEPKLAGTFIAEPIPEPGSAVLALFGLGMILRRRRSHR